MRCEPREPAASSPKRTPRRKSIKRQESSSHHTLQQQQQPPAPQSSPGAETGAGATFRSPAKLQAVASSTPEGQHYGANSSAVGFAAHMFGDTAAVDSSDITSIPGQAGRSKRLSVGPDSARTWSLVTMDCPPPAVMELLIDAYFARMQWFILTLHETSFRQKARHTFSRTSWHQPELGTVLVGLMASAVGLRSACRDPQWRGHAILSRCALPPDLLLDSLIKEVRFHLIDLLDDCCIETVQVCSMLGAYYMFHASPTLAWSIIGLSSRTAYALSLHCDSDDDHGDKESMSRDHDPITSQVRRRNWNHILVADTFAAMIYGRPASLDAAFSHVHSLSDLDDMAIGPGLLSHPQFGPKCRTDASSSRVVTLQTFHILKYRLYEIIRTSLNSFRVLRLQNPISPEELDSLVQTVQDVRASLDAWKAELPPIFDCDPDAQEVVLTELASIKNLSAREERDRHHLSLQIMCLCITYASAVIFVHRPLLEYRVAAGSRQAVPRRTLDVVAESLRLSVKAAIHMSRVPVKKLEHHFVMPFVLMNYFTAGVILCIPPTTWPLSAIAHEAKAGTLRIIRATRALKHVSPVAAHTEQLLTSLLRQSLQQEVDNGLQEELRLEMSLNEPQRAGSLITSDNQPLPPPGLDSPYKHEAFGQDAAASQLPTSARQSAAYFPMSSERSVPAAEEQQTPQPDDVLLASSTSSLDSNVNFMPGPSDLGPGGETGNYFASDSEFQDAPMGNYYSEQRNQVDSRIDEAIGTFGQSTLPSCHCLCVCFLRLIFA